MRASRGEIRIEEILIAAEINFEMEYIFPGLTSPNGRPLRFDFVIFDDDKNIDFIIEFQGKQHYQPVSKFGGNKGLYRQKYNDNKKRRFCSQMGYRLIEIPYNEEHLVDYDYIMKRAGY